MPCLSIVIYSLRSRRDGTIPSTRLCRAGLRLAPAAGTGREAGMPATADRASVASYAQFPAELDRDWLGRGCPLSRADLGGVALPAPPGNPPGPLYPPVHHPWSATTPAGTPPALSAQ